MKILVRVKTERFLDVGHVVDSEGGSVCLRIASFSGPEARGGDINRGLSLDRAAARAFAMAIPS